MKEDDITPQSLPASGWQQDSDLSKVERKGRRAKRKMAYRRGYWIVWFYEEEFDGVVQSRIKASSSVNLGQFSAVKTMRDLESLSTQEEKQ